MVTKNKVLILAPQDDAHAQDIAAYIESKELAEVQIWDSSGFPAKQQLSFYSDSRGVVLDGVGERSIELSQYASCWWRRPMAAEIPDDIDDPRVRNYCLIESDRLIRGALLASGCRLINDPLQQSMADHKPYQLKHAKALGLNIPDTLMCNDPNAVRDFVAKYKGRVVFKAFHSPSWRIVETREWSEELNEDLQTLKYAPVIFQELIDLGRDVRVTVIGDQVFAAEVSSRSEVAYLDWRLDTSVQWLSISLPIELQTMIFSLMKVLGLDYGALDFRQNSKGEWVFLEINPSGQFLFMEDRDTYNLRHAFTQLLLS
ncbi:MvdC/MvdD family ATP grasp protein [Agaribacterium sp. ZY112]|uniref:MvdC/MvdD family ATP grasp protein n=1 Tax=Agaribacterium sp. ZY112 TaxID=3233574 RepID=UPI003525CB7C